MLQADRILTARVGIDPSLLEASAFVQTLEKRQGLWIACPEKIAFNQGFITRSQFVALARKFEKSSYGQYLLRGLGVQLKLWSIELRCVKF
jgi:glucose-1-phosphate thymidylyltransferase